MTLSNLVAAISAAGGGFTYSYIDIDPVNDEDGGASPPGMRWWMLFDSFLVPSCTKVYRGATFGRHTCGIPRRLAWYLALLLALPSRPPP